MAVIECRGLYKDYSGTVVLRSVDLEVREGEHLALVGPNGAGKTTLLRALAGEDEDYRGGVALKPGARLAYLPQHVEPPGDGTALDFLASDAAAAEARVRAAEEALAAAREREASRLLADYQAALDAWEELGGARAVERAGRALALVGLAGRERTRARDLSGGERGTLALAKALQGNPDLLLLDEPGNHLDFRGLAWLEDFLAQFRGAVLLVSHDRSLIDRTATRVVELEGGRARSWTGGYSEYRLSKLRLAATQGADWQASRKRIARLEEMVNRAAVLAAAFTKRQVKANGSLGQKLRARRRQLERAKAESVAKPELGSTAIRARFDGRGAGDVRSDFALIVDGYSKAFGPRVLFEDASFEVRRGERVALVGPNGSGKTTFLRELAFGHDWENGPLRVVPGMKIGYVAQDRDGFERGRSIADEFARLGATGHETRRLLRDFGFADDDPEKLADSLSGGELNRLQLARAIRSGANFLVLDEPTNHLDLDARESVEERLAEYDGTILVVSHDRYFLSKVAERVVLVEDGCFVEFEGSVDELRASYGPPARREGAGGFERGRRGGVSIEERGRALALAERSGATGSPDRVEERILALEEEKGALERRIRAAFDARDFKGARRLSNELEELHRDIERQYAKWA
ncbi:MAG: ABC-F family ATP-binding cassette domain-containing protein [Spirochaetia bacterium]|nr:ABC-F family ATP-binding cassette domain-containing protein [Spirochaetia bacterium]